MLSPSECLLQAENYAIAASMADEESRMVMLEQAALWRRRAHELQMLRFEHLREIDPDAPNHGGLAD